MLKTRVKVAASGKIDSAELLRVEAPSPVELATCNLLRKLQYDLSKPGFEMNEIVMTTNP